jgi:hypothetical protein
VPLEGDEVPLQRRIREEDMKLFGSRGKKTEEPADTTDTRSDASAFELGVTGFVADGAKPSGFEVVVIDNSSEEDNWLVNETDIPVTVCCDEQGAPFTVDLLPGQKKRITTEVVAAPYPQGEYHFDDMSYLIRECEEWAVRREGDGLVLVKTRG